MSDSLRPQGLQHARPPCPSPFPSGVCRSSCSLHWWCHPVISSSDALFSFCPQSFPASETFPVSWLWASDDQNIGALALAIRSYNEHSGLISLKIDWFDLLAVQRTFRSLLQHHNWKASILWHSAFQREFGNIWGIYLKNWCFWTVVLEKTLESPLDCKDLTSPS